MRQRPMNRRINHEALHLVGHSGGVLLTAQVAICSWNSGAGVTLLIEFDGGGDVCVRDPQLAVEDATEADYQRMINSVKVIPCRTCGGPAFDPTVCDTNRDGECEACFLRVLDAELEQGLAKQAKKLAKLDAKAKAQGYTHRVEGWIHPVSGEDRQISLWLQNPTPAVIRAELKRSGSVDPTDYQLIEL